MKTRVQTVSALQKARSLAYAEACKALRARASIQAAMGDIGEMSVALNAFDDLLENVRAVEAQDYLQRAVS